MRKRDKTDIVYEDDWADLMLLAYDGGGRPGELAYDPHEPVRAALAASPRTDLTPDVLDAMAGDRSPRVRAALAGRDGLSEDLVERLSWDADPRVLAALASRQALPDALRSRLARCADPRVQAALGDVRTSMLLDDLGFRGSCDA